MEWSEERVRIDVGDGVAVSAVHLRPEPDSRNLQVIYAPGAGSNLDDGFGVYLCEELARNGIEAWRFQFPYMEAGRRSPDPARRLEATWRAVIEHAATASERLIVAGGRSMGGRIASQVVAAGVHVSAMVLFAYPLVAPGKPNEPRSEHFRDITVPTLFCSGTRDSFATAEQLKQASELVQDASVHLLEGADHGFAVPKSSGRTKQGVFAEAVEAALKFLSRVEARRQTG